MLRGVEPSTPTVSQAWERGMARGICSVLSPLHFQLASVRQAFGRWGWVWPPAYCRARFGWCSLER